MRWDEFVEDVTEGIANRRLARDARAELRDHLESATEEFVAEGLDRDVAEARALERLGPRDVLAAQFRQRYHERRPLWPVVVAAVGAVCGLALVGGGGAPSWGVFLALWSVAFAAAHARSFISLFRDPWPRLESTDLKRRLQAHLPFVAAGALTGAMVVWNLPAMSFGVLSVVVGAGAFEAAGWWVRRGGAEPEQAPVGAVVGAVGFAVAACVLGTASWRAYGLGWAGSAALGLGAVYFTGCRALWHVRRLYGTRSALEQLAPVAPTR